MQNPYLTRRPFILLPILAGLPLLKAQAQDGGVTRFIVTSGAGSATDAIARFMANGLTKAWGVSTVVENKLGAGGVIGTEAVAKAPPDGKSILFTYSAHYSNQWVMKTPYDAVQDFEPVARLASSALMVSAGPNSRFQSVRDIITAARQKPGTITFGSAGMGTTSHMAGALLATMAGIELVHVPYKAPGEVVVAVSSGLVDLAIGGLATYAPMVKAGRLKGIAVTTARRSAMLPEMPTLSEAGLPGYDISSYSFALAPRGTPATQIQRMSDVFTRLAATPEFKELCASVSNDVDIQDASTFKADAPKQLEHWRKLAGLTKEKAS